MKLTWTILTAFALLPLSVAQASPAVVAVMPVQGVNLSAGQCDVIGLLFADAFARETRVVVASPTDTKPLLAQGKAPLAVATQLGVVEYIELRALQLGTRVTVAGIVVARMEPSCFAPRRLPPAWMKWRSRWPGLRARSPGGNP